MTLTTRLDKDDTQAMTTTSTFGQLKAGDRMVCPSDGMTEKVVRTWRVGVARCAVRTTRHDHHRLRSDPVERAKG